MDKVVVRQNQRYEVTMMVQAEEDKHLHQVSEIYELSPYTMMLASLGLCTGVVVHSYAHHHGVPLEMAEITTTYHREEVQDPDAATPYNEWIEEAVTFEGDLSEKQLTVLERVAHHCSIRKMLESGIEIRT
jgi:uncharacterized OsmC-like protein